MIEIERECINRVYISVLEFDIKNKKAIEHVCAFISAEIVRRFQLRIFQRKNLPLRVL